MSKRLMTYSFLPFPGDDLSQIGLHGNRFRIPVPQFPGQKKGSLRHRKSGVYYKHNLFSDSDKPPFGPRVLGERLFPDLDSELRGDGAKVVPDQEIPVPAVFPNRATGFPSCLSRRHHPCRHPYKRRFDLESRV